jgi:hypothetical protein
MDRQGTLTKSNKCSMIITGLVYLKTSEVWQGRTKVLVLKYSTKLNKFTTDSVILTGLHIATGYKKGGDVFR